MDVKHDKDHTRFHAATGSGEATLDYAMPDDRTLDIRSTFVPPAARGQGFGAAIVLHVLGYARQNGYRVIPTCPFVHRVLDENPGYEDLIATR